ncbi:hypothetical protein [Nocardia sp. NBC_01388]|uniref:hypothetical protein n=1 Tax=Nocardia sp. NBC_01388 TaxID=2903596 RepID=UPI00324F1069
MLHTTVIRDATVSWRLAGNRIAMETLTDLASAHRPACRVHADGSIADAPEGAPGTVYFGRDDERPDLVQVRDWLPKHAALWDAVRAQYWDAVLPLDHPRFRGLGEVATMPYRR